MVGKKYLGASQCTKIYFIRMVTAIVRHSKIQTDYMYRNNIFLKHQTECPPYLIIPYGSELICPLSVFYLAVRWEIEKGQAPHDYNCFSEKRKVRS